MGKIVYLIEQPLDERNYDRFGIQTWLDRGWEVIVFDLTPWAHSRVWECFTESGQKLKKFAGYFSVASKDQLEYRCSRLGKVGYFIDLTGDNKCTIPAKKILTRNKAIRVTCAAGLIPAPGYGRGGKSVSRLRKAFAAGPIKTFQWLTEMLLRKFSGASIASGVVIVSGEKSIPSADHAREIIKAHNFDYDIYLKRPIVIDPPDKEYAVFIDQDYCFHSDFTCQTVPLSVSPEKYFPAIFDALSRISEALAVDVRVAAHPRSTYWQRNGNFFEGFSVEYGKTADLIRGCKVIVCHDSTAVQFAVLFGKPAIFLTTDEIAPFYEGRSIVKMASELGKSVINLSRGLRSVDWRSELSVDSVKYAEYKRKYIKTDGSPEIPLWDIVVNYIERAERLASANLPDQGASACAGE